jgi:hypothetical protein
MASTVRYMAPFKKIPLFAYMLSATFIAIYCRVKRRWGHDRKRYWQVLIDALGITIRRKTSWANPTDSIMGLCHIMSAVVSAQNTILPFPFPQFAVRRDVSARGPYCRWIFGRKKRQGTEMPVLKESRYMPCSATNTDKNNQTQQKCHF